jgi:hypothetical protein
MLDLVCMVPDKLQRYTIFELFVILKYQYPILQVCNDGDLFVGRCFHPSLQVAAIFCLCIQIAIGLAS